MYPRNAKREKGEEEAANAANRFIASCFHAAHSPLLLEYAIKRYDSWSQQQIKLISPTCSLPSLLHFCRSCKCRWRLINEAKGRGINPPVESYLPLLLSNAFLFFADFKKLKSEKEA